MYRGDTELEGDGVYFSAAEEYVRISSNTFLRADGKTLSSVRADYDRPEGVAMFDGDVKVTGVEGGKPYEISADRMFGFVGGTNDLRRIVAIGGVRVKSDKRSGSCARAAYVKAESKVVMYGGEEGYAHLEDGEGGSAEGRRITFWLDSEHVEIVESRISIQPGGMKLPKGGASK